MPIIQQHTHYLSSQREIGSIPIQRDIAVAVLKRLSDYTGHPSDLENVIALTTRNGERA